MIKLADIDDLSNWKYLDQNPDFADQLVATLNQIDGFRSDDWWFNVNYYYWIYDYFISPNYEIKKDTFAIGNDQISIRSTNRDDLLNVRYYQHLNDLANNHSIKKYSWIYFPQDQVVQLEASCWPFISINIKLTKSIEQYDQKQLNLIAKLMTNVSDLIFKDDEFDRDQFDEQWKQGFSRIRSIGIVFDLNDFANPKILVRWEDENLDDQYENDYLRQVLKIDAPLLDYLKQFEQDDHNQSIINQVD